MALQILIAGAKKEDQERLKSLVATVIGQRAKSGAWRVSLVQVGAKWLVTLKGPGLAEQGASFQAAEADIRESILAALGQGGPVQQPSAAPPAETAEVSPAGQTDEYTCAGCQEKYRVIYESRADEPQMSAPVACPHCWQVNEISIGEWAALGEEYRAEKI